MKDEKDNLEIRSEEVSEILGTPPGWLIHWGILTISLIILVLLAFSWFYKYPDQIKARIVIITENPPVTIFSKATGKLDKLFVTDQQPVEKGEILGIIENPANFEDACHLLQRLDSISNFPDNPEMITSMKEAGNYHLGQVHSWYAAFIAQVNEYLTSQNFNLYTEKMVSLQQQASDLDRYLQQLNKQAQILNDKLSISRKQLSRDSALFRKNVISETDLEKSRTEMLGTELDHSNALANIANARMQLAQIRRQITENQNQKSEQQNNLLSSVREKYENLYNQLLAWEQTYVLRTPVSGKVTFTNIWKINQQIAEGTPVFSVVPLSKQNIIGRVQIPVSGSGKVKVHQKVNIRLDNYPYLEYGMLRGKITGISLVPSASATGDYYTAEVSLDEGLKTNYNRTLPFGQELQGDAEIITNDRRLIERLVAPLVSLFRERMLTN